MKENDPHASSAMKIDSDADSSSDSADEPWRPYSEVVQELKVWNGKWERFAKGTEPADAPTKARHAWTKRRADLRNHIDALETERTWHLNQEKAMKVAKDFLKKLKLEKKQAEKKKKVKELFQSKFKKVEATK
jgi:hypothetical protein